MDVEKKGRILTHVIKEPLAKEGYTRLSYMTADVNNTQIHYQDFENRPFTEKFLQAKIDSGSMVKLAEFVPIDRSQSVWVDFKGNVYANRDDPFTDIDGKEPVCSLG